MRDSERPSRALARAGAVLEIDLAAIVANWRRLAAELKPGTECAAVVKADAYGLGLARVAPRSHEERIIQTSLLRGMNRLIAGLRLARGVVGGQM